MYSVIQLTARKHCVRINAFIVILLLSPSRRAVMVKQDGGDMTVLNAEEVVTESEAKAILKSIKEPAKVLEARLGIEDNEPFWEVAYKDSNGQLEYVWLSVRTGELLKEYQSI